MVVLAYLDTGLLKFFYFTLLLCLYVIIVASNVVLIAVICSNRSLHEPMYVFVASLCVNELYGSTGLFPFLLVQILSDVHTISAPLCFLQIFIVHSYGAVEFLNLAAMSYERYVAICDPLQYSTRVTLRTVAKLVAFAWSYPCFAMVVSLLLSHPLQLCGNRGEKFYCDMHSVVKQACSDTAAINMYGLAATFSTIVTALLLILYNLCEDPDGVFSLGPDRHRQRAVNTCTPHLASILNFSFAGSFEISQSRFDMSFISSCAANLLSLYFLTVQPFNPVMYGLKMDKIRNISKRLIYKYEVLSRLISIDNIFISNR
ncbi:LOW QUALITY PROTEIN: odorant receptor 128-10 [Xenentodon cancila]